MEPTQAAKTPEELATERTAYLQRVLKLEDDYENLKDKLPELRDELMQVRGALAYVEMTLEELAQKQLEIDRQTEKARVAEAMSKPPGEEETPTD